MAEEVPGFYMRSSSSLKHNTSTLFFGGSSSLTAKRCFSVGFTVECEHFHFDELAHLRQKVTPFTACLLLIKATVTAIAK
jgi:hypothetical protein